MKILMKNVRAFWIKDFAILGGKLELDVKVGMKVLVVRNDELIVETTIDEIKHYKDSFESMSAGTTCGLKVNGVKGMDGCDLLLKEE